MTKTKTIPAVEARVHLGKIMQLSFKKGLRFIVEKAGIPTVAIINAAEFKRLVQEKEERFKVLDLIRAKLPNIPEEQVEKDTAEAINAVRKLKNA